MLKLFPRNWSKSETALLCGTALDIGLDLAAEMINHLRRRLGQPLRCQSDFVNRFLTHTMTTTVDVHFPADFDDSQMVTYPFTSLLKECQGRIVLNSKGSLDGAETQYKLLAFPTTAQADLFVEWLDGAGVGTLQVQVWANGPHGFDQADQMEGSSDAA